MHYAGQSRKEELAVTNLDVQASRKKRFAWSV
jgi:hypothetical protein